MLARKNDDINIAYRIYTQSGNRDDFEVLLETGRKLVAHFARLYTGGTGEDVLQAGMEGLIKAASRYDVERGTSFVTYAAHCVMGEIRHFVRRESSYYRPGTIKDLQFKVDRYVEMVLKESGKVPEVAEVAAALKVKEEGVLQAMRAGLISLDEIDISKIRADRYESFKLPIEDRLVLEQALRKLSSLQKRVIYYLFYRDMTQTEAAEKLGISQRKVSRILRKSLREMGKDLKP